MKKSGTAAAAGKSKPAAKTKSAKKAKAPGAKKQEHVTPEMILGGTLLLGQKGSQAVGRAATETYGWIKGQVAGLMKGKKKKAATKKPAKKSSKKKAAPKKR